jgi:hypothetical protein
MIAPTNFIIAKNIVLFRVSCDEQDRERNRNRVRQACYAGSSEVMSAMIFGWAPIVSYDPHMRT